MGLGYVTHPPIGCVVRNPVTLASMKASYGKGQTPDMWRSNATMHDLPDAHCAKQSAVPGAPRVIDRRKDG